MNIEQWDLFWNAFGAIGTTIGSLTTAIAVIVAVKQYKQPLEKRIVVSHTFAFPIVDDEIGEDLINIEVKNIGIREIKVASINFKYKKGVFYMLNMQSDINHINLPCTLKPEESINYLIKREAFLKALNDNKQIKNNSKFKFIVKDSMGVGYCDKKSVRYKNRKLTL